MWDEEGRIHHCNRQAAKMFGTDTAQLLGALWNDKLIWPEELRLAVRANADVVRAESTVQLDNRRVTSLVTLRAIKGGKETAGVCGTISADTTNTPTDSRAGRHQKPHFDWKTSPASPPLQRVLRQAHIAARASIPAILTAKVASAKLIWPRRSTTGATCQSPVPVYQCRAIRTN